jgi:hypothetical protein
MYSELKSWALRKTYWARGAAVFALFFICFAAEARPQDQPDGPWEVGGQFTATSFHAPGEKALGFGGRVGRGFGSHLGFEAEANYYPQNPSSNYGETEVVAGVKAGGHLGRWSLFGKLRPGLMNFGGDFARRNPGVTSRFALDVGGVAELNLTPRFGLRFDVGDTIIFYGGELVNNGLNTFRPGADHNLQTSFGLFFHF